MDFNRIRKGMKVRVLNWRTVRDTYPPHWSQEMDNYIGLVLTVAKVQIASFYVKENTFYWTGSDVEAAYALPADDPSTLFKKRKLRTSNNGCKSNEY